MPPPPRPPPPKRPGKKQKAPTVATPEQILSRQKGALWGLAVGEAMGVKNERRNLPAVNFPELMDGPQIEPQRGGPYERVAGQVSWGAEMACVLALTLRELGSYSVEDVGRAYARWLPKTKPEPVPEPIKAALQLIIDGRSPIHVGKRVWLESFQTIKDNSPLVRTIPIGVYFHAQRDVRTDASLADIAITHFDPLCQIAATTFNGLIGTAIDAVGEHLKPPQLLKAVENELLAAAAQHGRREPDWAARSKDASDWLREDVRMAQLPDPELYGPELHLFAPWPTPIRTTFRLALWEALHAPNFETAIIDVVNRGGDSVTNAAVTAALIGAIHGEEVIPPLWKQWVIDSPMNAMHPTALVTLAGKEPGAPSSIYDDPEY